VTVHYDVHERRATVRLDRPEVLNALDRPTLEAIRDHMREASADHAVGVVVITVFRHVGPSRGSLPAGGATQWMTLLVGDRRAREVLLLNEPIPAQRAMEWGWINRVVPRAELDATVDELCGRLLEKMPEIVRATKVELDFWKDLSWAMTIRMAREWLTVHAGSAEVAEGLASFEAKRPVDYEGLRRAIEDAGQ
jgi:enoyl-CoA hydratase/carnithine racemase